MNLCMFPHIPGHVNTNDLYVRASLDLPISGAEVLALMAEAEAAEEDRDATKERHKEEIEEEEDEHRKTREKVDALTTLCDKLASECADLKAEIKACGKHTYAEFEKMEAERDKAVSDLGAFVNASITWSSTNLAAFILDTAERNRIENEALKAELAATRAILTPKQRKALPR